jgi:hypothetical protein
MAKEYVKNFSVSLEIKEMQIKTTLKSGTNGSHPIILASWEAETGRIEAS